MKIMFNKIYNVIKDNKASIIAHIIVFGSIFYYTHASITGLNEKINYMELQEQIVQDNLTIASNTIQELQNDLGKYENEMNNLNQQLVTQNQTIFELQSREQEVANLLNNFNLNETIETVNLLKEETQQINSSIENLQSMLINDVSEIKEIYNSTLFSLKELNYTLWEKSFDIDAELNNMQNNITDFEDIVNQNIRFKGFRATTSTQQNISIGPLNNIIFENIDFDTEDYYNSTTGHATITKDGFYEFYLSLIFSTTWETGYTLNTYMLINNNGIPCNTNSATPTQGFILTIYCSQTFQLKTGDNVSVALYLDIAGSNINFGIVPSYLNQFGMIEVN